MISMPTGRSAPPDPRPLRAGFSMMEMVVVVAIIALMALMAGPAITRLVPMQRLRGEAQNVATLLRQARLKAANAQKPTRVVLDCSGLSAAPPQPCWTLLETAKYEHGQVTDWTRADSGRRDLDYRARAAWQDPGAGGDGLITRPGVSWIIFMPSGRAYSNPRPFDLVFSATDLSGPRRTGWRLAVSSDSGRATLNPTPLP